MLKFQRKTKELGDCSFIYIIFLYYMWIHVEIPDMSKASFDHLIGSQEERGVFRDKILCGYLAIIPDLG